MDGRNLSNEIITSYDPTKTTLYDIAQMIPKFVKKVLNLTSYYFYGSFSVGAVYDLKNFNNMLVSSFPCRIDYSLEINNEEYDSPEGGYTLILSDDCLVLFENFETDPTIGKVAFWATLYAITDIQINKNTKIVKINFYSEDKVVDKQIRLHIMNVLFFREALVKRMHNLKVKIEENKLHKGHLIDKRLTQRDISLMTISQIEQSIQILKKNINNNELSYYVINTFSILCGKAIEYYSANGDDNKKSVYLNEMKTILLKPDVQVIMQEQH